MAWDDSVLHHVAESRDEQLRSLGSRKSGVIRQPILLDLISRVLDFPL
jgi:hypothetical protein